MTDAVTLSSGEWQFLDKLGRFYGQYLPGAAMGEVLGLLLLSEMPLSQAAIAPALGLSPAMTFMDVVRQENESLLACWQQRKAA